MNLRKQYIKRIPPQVLLDLKKLVGCKVTSLSCEAGSFKIGEPVRFEGYGKTQVTFWNEHERRHRRLDFMFGSPFQGADAEWIPMKAVEIPQLSAKEWIAIRRDGADVTGTVFEDWDKMKVSLDFNFESPVLQSIKIYHFMSEWHSDETPEIHNYDYVAFIEFEMSMGKKWVLQGNISLPSFELYLNDSTALEAHLKMINDDRGPTFGQPLYKLVHVIE